MHTKEAIVLAGGLGTRMKSVLPDFPKCMAPVGGKPFLTYVLNYLENQGINKVILSVGYYKDIIISYFDNKFNSIEIEYAIENEPLGTGGAVKFALTYITGNEAFVVNGDTYFTPDLTEMEDFHRSSSAEISIGVKHIAKAERYGLVIADESGRIKEFREKESGAGSGWINGGVYLLNSKSLNYINEKKFSLENDVFKASCESGNIFAFKTDSFFLDIGIPDDYLKAQTLIPEIEKG